MRFGRDRTAEAAFELRLLGRVLIGAMQAYTGREMTPVEVYRAARKQHDQIWNVFVARPLAERPAGSRTVEALVPADAPPAVVEDLLERLQRAAQAYARQA